MLEAVILGDGSAPYQQIVRILSTPAPTGDRGRRRVTALQHATDRGQAEVAAVLAG